CWLDQHRPLLSGAIGTAVVSQRVSTRGRLVLQLRTNYWRVTSSAMKAKRNGRTKRVELGDFIVADPRICHGKATFKGTRIMVYQVLEQVAYGTPWERIVWSW